MTKQLFLLSSVKTSGRFFQIFVAFSEKLDFTKRDESDFKLEILVHLASLFIVMKIIPQRAKIDFIQMQMIQNNSKLNTVLKS